MLKSALQQPNNGKSGQVRVGDFLSINLLMSVCVVEHHSVVQFFLPQNLLALCSRDNKYSW